MWSTNESHPYTFFLGKDIQIIYSPLLSLQSMARKWHPWYRDVLPGSEIGYLESGWWLVPFCPHGLCFLSTYGNKEELLKLVTVFEHLALCLSYSDLPTNIEWKRNESILGNFCHELHLVEAFGVHKSWPKDEESRREKKNWVRIIHPKRMNIGSKRNFQNFSL